MGVWVGILVGVAAGAVFFVVQLYLVQSAYPWNLGWSVVVFVIASALALLVQRKITGEATRGTSIASDNEVHEDMKASIDGLEADQPVAKVLSGNKIDGNADFQIKNSKI